MISVSDIEDTIKSIPSHRMAPGVRAWTTAVKRAFAILGKKHEWGVCAAVSEADVEAEWLWDVTFYRRQNENEFEIGLVLESEWSPHFYDLRFDFEKLLAAKAPYKVFIFEAGEPEASDLLARLEVAIDRCKHSSQGEIYFLAYCDPHSEKFSIRRKHGV